MNFILTFDGLCLRYVRIVGTHNTVNKVFHLVAFECMFTHRPFTLDNGLLGKSQGAFHIWDRASVNNFWCLQYPLTTWQLLWRVPVSSRVWVAAEMPCSMETHATMTGTLATPATSWDQEQSSSSWLSPSPSARSGMSDTSEPKCCWGFYFVKG